MSWTSGPRLVGYHGIAPSYVSLATDLLRSKGRVSGLRVLVRRYGVACWWKADQEGWGLGMVGHMLEELGQELGLEYVAAPWPPSRSTCLIIPL